MPVYVISAANEDLALECARAAAIGIRGRGGEDIVMGRDVDVIEVSSEATAPLDAIRDITEAAKYRPSAGGARVLIVWRPEGLSQGGKNALGHLLNDPPPHLHVIVMPARFDALSTLAR